MPIALVCSIRAKLRNAGQPPDKWQRPARRTWQVCWQIVIFAVRGLAGSTKCFVGLWDFDFRAIQDRDPPS